MFTSVSQRQLWKSLYFSVFFSEVFRRTWLYRRTPFDWRWLEHNVLQLCSITNPHYLWNDCTFFFGCVYEFMFFTILSLQSLLFDINKSFLQLRALGKSYYMNCLIGRPVFPACLLARSFASSELDLLVRSPSAINPLLDILLLHRRPSLLFLFFIYTEKLQLPLCFHNSICSL